MAYTNSPLVTYTKISPCNSGQRTQPIDRITPHCVVGQVAIESLGGWFSYASTKASSNYGIDKDGRVGMFVPESNRSWCTSSSANDNRAITIECASDTFHPYAMKEIVYETLVKLCIDICKRNNKKKLIWFNSKNERMSYIPKTGEMLITVHRDYANKACPGDWLYSRLGDLASRVTKALSSVTIDIEVPKTNTVTATSPKTTTTVRRGLVRIGDAGEDVKEIQRLLNKFGGYGLNVDGAFGAKTWTAVYKFQQANKLDTDGVVGPLTWAALDKINKKEDSKSEVKTVSELAKEVISGKWGNGAERKEKLIAAGYDYSEVQKEVNRLMKG